MRALTGLFMSVAASIGGAEEVFPQAKAEGFLEKSSAGKAEMLEEAAQSQGYGIQNLGSMPDQQPS